MATKIDQKEYLKRYLSNDKEKKKKKKKEKKVVAKANVRIIDDDLDISKLQTIEGDEVDMLALGEDAPQVVGIIDERPAELRAKEDFGSNKWKVFAAHDGFDAPLEVRNVSKRNGQSSGPSDRAGKEKGQDSDESPPRKVANAGGSSARRGKDLESEAKRGHDSDASPPRRRQPDADPRKGRRKREDSDESPPRKSKHSSSKKIDRYDSDESPPRKNRQRDESPPRKSHAPEKQSERSRQRQDSDESPPRRQHAVEKKSERRRQGHDSDESPPRRSRPSEKKSERSRQRQDSDESPPRRPRATGKESERTRQRPDSDESPPRRHRRGPEKIPERNRQRQDSDESPPRSRSEKVVDGRHPRKHDVENQRGRRSPPRRDQRRDSDESPPRRNRDEKPSTSRAHRNREDSDASPPRRWGETKRRETSPGRKRRYGSSHGGASRPGRASSSPGPSVVRVKQEKNRSDSDQSPPRHHARSSRRDSDESPPRRRRETSRAVAPAEIIDSDGEPGRDATTGRMTKTLEGKRAGLQDARALREENEKHKRRETEAFEKLAVEHSGRYAETVVRQKSGRRKDIEKELREEFEKRKHEEKKKEIYTRWGKGVKQTEEYNARLQEAAHEMDKPLARYADDKDLDEHLKQQEREGDPMLEYLRSKRKEENRRAGVPEKPTYQGAFPDNRYGIRPGYRWDGVDRSNGFEKRWFETMSKKKATEEEAYKYSVEDM